MVAELRRTEQEDKEVWKVVEVSHMVEFSRSKHTIFDYLGIQSSVNSNQYHAHYNLWK